MWCRPLTNQNLAQRCAEVHRGEQRCAHRCAEGCAEAHRGVHGGPLLYVLGYHWLHLATIDLVSDNREFDI